MGTNELEGIELERIDELDRTELAGAELTKTELAEIELMVGVVIKVVEDEGG